MGWFFEEPYKNPKPEMFWPSRTGIEKPSCSFLSILSRVHLEWFFWVISSTHDCFCKWETHGCCIHEFSVLWPSPSGILSEYVKIKIKMLFFKTIQFIFHKAFFWGPGFTLLQWPEKYSLQATSGLQITLCWLAKWCIIPNGIQPE